MNTDTMSLPRRGFASDNNAPVHPKIMQALSQINQGHALAYGDDEATARAIDSFKACFGEDIAVYFVYNGTGANVLGLSAVLQGYQSVICTQTAHLHVDECGAPERFIGCKLLDVPTPDGKLTVAGITGQLQGVNDQHHVQPKVVSITQSTELGTVYSLEQLSELVEYAHANDLLVHMDGARISNAAVSLGVSLKALTTDTGIDVLSFGGTKNGLMFGEALVFFKPELADSFKYLRKQGMQLASKMRYIAAQYQTYLDERLCYDNARHANAKATLLAGQLRNIKPLTITQAVESNAVFCLMPKSIIKPLQAHYFFYVWDDRGDDDCAEVRLMTSFDTEEEDIAGFVAALKEVLSTLS